MSVGIASRALPADVLTRPHFSALPPLSLYVHIPWCVRKCPYCDFNSHAAPDALPEDAYVDALITDLESALPSIWGRKVSTVFIGGGTPSLVSAAAIDRLLGAVRARVQLSPDAEITLEANPGTFEREKFAGFYAAGVNRLSLGLQSFDDEALHFLGRAHSATEGLAALEIAQKHFPRVSFDLIYALPGDTEESWSASLRRALALGTAHLSLYQLTIEPGTRFASMVARRDFEPLDSDAAAALYELTDAMTSAAGLPAYEISNHSAPGAESRHNLTYWRYGDYAGVGPGAHGRRLGSRTVRHKKPENFLSGLARNGNGIAEEESLTPREAADEALVMGLRLTEGIDPDALEVRFGTPVVDVERVQRLVESGHLARSGARLALTPSGRLLLDAILGEIAA